MRRSAAGSLAAVALTGSFEHVPRNSVPGWVSEIALKNADLLVERVAGTLFRGGYRKLPCTKTPGTLFRGGYQKLPCTKTPGTEFRGTVHFTNPVKNCISAVALISAGLAIGSLNKT